MKSIIVNQPSQNSVGKGKLIKYKITEWALLNTKPEALKSNSRNSILEYGIKRLRDGNYKREKVKRYGCSIPEARGFYKRIS